MDKFLPDILVALDAEFTGVCPGRDQLLQVAMVKLVLDRDQYVPGEALNIHMKCDARPSNEFHFKYLLPVFDQCNESAIDAPEAKRQIDEFLKDWRGKAIPFGDCVISDLRFLYENKVIDEGDIVDGETVPGTFHYEIYDLNAIKDIARTKNGAREDLALEGAHDALQDCYNQIQELNWCLKVLLS